MINSYNVTKSGYGRPICKSTVLSKTDGHEKKTFNPIGERVTLLPGSAVTTGRVTRGLVGVCATRAAPFACVCAPVDLKNKHL
jgi:hypothetical protein